MIKTSVDSDTISVMPISSSEEHSEVFDEETEE
jgi:hypothetical protein